MRALLVLGAALLAAPAWAQVGIQTVCFGFAGDLEVACVTETVTCVSRFTNDSANGESWTADELRITVNHPSGPQESGNLLAVPVDVPAGVDQASFAEGAFTWVARAEDVPMVFGRAFAAAYRTADGPESGHFTGDFPNVTFVGQCGPEVLAANRATLFAESRLARCRPVPGLAHRRVCRTATEAFVAPLP